MEKKPTDELNEILENTKPEQVGAYFQDNRKFLVENRKSFYTYFTDILAEKRIKLNYVYSFADVSESYGGQIVRMEKHTKNRDLILRLCIAGHLSLDETNRALKLYGMRELYAKDKRDVILIVAINNRIYQLAEIDDLLQENGFAGLIKNEEN